MTLNQWIILFIIIVIAVLGAIVAAYGLCRMAGRKAPKPYECNYFEDEK